jgi:dipeptidyl aminopeptidase/acylaminoacyl peptidase
MIEAPYGAWASPLSPEDAAAASGRFGSLVCGPDEVTWVEIRPGDDGRSAVLAAAPGRAPREVGPEGAVAARSRVNEYGGGAMWTGPDGAGGERLFWVAAADQRVCTLDDEDSVRTLSPLPPSPRAWRHAAGVVGPSGAWTICERELHVDDTGAPLSEAVNDLAVVWTSGGVQPLLGPDDPGGGDFVAAPALSPDGQLVAWLRWDHPDMPWDAAELWVARVGSGPDETSGGERLTLTEHRRVAGGRDGALARGIGHPVSVCLPSWAPDGSLWWCDDADEYWHLRRLAPGLPERGAGDVAPLAMAPVQEEVGEPRWVSGGARYGFTDDGRVVFAAMAGGLDSLWVSSLDGSDRERVPGPEFTSVDSLRVRGTVVAVIAASSELVPSVWRIDLASGEAVDLRDAVAPLSPEWVSAARPITFPTGTASGAGNGNGSDAGDGPIAHALFYAPTSGDHHAPEGELPPLVVRIHGGPTAAARPELSPSVQFWTTRGFAVVDVNYRGSTGFGRSYRDLLQGEWGRVDVEDCLAAARHLGAEGLVDPARCVIRGGSAGGFTTLAALCFQDAWGQDGTFSAGCSLYGVTDLAALAAETHKFESRYLDGLVGPLPDAAEVYRERSPLFHADALSQPVLLLQGAEDRIVPPAQAKVLVDALRARGVPYAYVLFPGEGHGFLASASIIRALGTELAFYGRVLGFRPADRLPPFELTGRVTQSGSASPG